MYNVAIHTGAQITLNMEKTYTESQVRQIVIDALNQVDTLISVCHQHDGYIDTNQREVERFLFLRLHDEYPATMESKNQKKYEIDFLNSIVRTCKHTNCYNDAENSSDYCLYHGGTENKWKT